MIPLELEHFILMNIVKKPLHSPCFVCAGPSLHRLTRAHVSKKDGFQGIEIGSMAGRNSCVMLNTL